MLIPIRCFSCGKEISSRWEEYIEKTGNTERIAETLDELGFKRPCCRTAMMTTIDIMQKMHKYEYPQEAYGDMLL
ncbi:DNA-directed RNA polymerases I, II, and III subunit RPABC5 [Nematocida sp. AWRm80]|nr:DNA-directed RNA polymerases I, II, and III subunit RPABC5 [Nematocida sp. AWRm80]